MMTDLSTQLENARGYFNENYVMCGLAFVVVALLLGGKRKAALLVAGCAALLYGAYVFLSGIHIGI